MVVDATRPFTLASAVAWKEDIDRQVTLPPAYREKKLQFPVILLVNKVCFCLFGNMRKTNDSFTIILGN